jgi:cardiolipin synthase A/B
MPALRSPNTTHFGLTGQRFWYRPERLNNRTHRKLLIVDGKVGFIGGVGIADEWDGHAQDPQHYRDNHYRIEGPVVAELQAAFLDNWLRTNGSVLQGSDYFPPLEAVGSEKAQAFKSSRRSGSESARLMYLVSITSASRSVRLASAYFVPDKLAINTFAEAARRGVRIEIIVPDRTSINRWCAKRRAAPGRNCSPREFESTSTSQQCSTASI